MKPMSKYTGEMPDNFKEDLDRIRGEAITQFEVREECCFVFGEERAMEMSHTERCAALAAFYDDIWHEKGGVGRHPYSDRFRSQL